MKNESRVKISIANPARHAPMDLTIDGATPNTGLRVCVCKGQGSSIMVKVMRFLDPRR
jgi:hypothetical protein